MKINRFAVRATLSNCLVSCLLNGCKQPVQSDIKLASTPYRNQSMKKARTKHVHTAKKRQIFSRNAMREIAWPDPDKCSMNCWKTFVPYIPLTKFSARLRTQQRSIYYTRFYGSTISIVRNFRLFYSKELEVSFLISRVTWSSTWNGFRCSYKLGILIVHRLYRYMLE